MNTRVVVSRVDLVTARVGLIVVKVVPVVAEVDLAKE